MRGLVVIPITCARQRKRRVVIEVNDPRLTRRGKYGTIARFFSRRAGADKCSALKATLTSPRNYRIFDRKCARHFR